MTTNDNNTKTVCECGDPDCLKGSQTFTPGKGEAQGTQGQALADAVRVLLAVPQLQGVQAFSAQPIINRVRAALAIQPFAPMPAEISRQLMVKIIDEVFDGGIEDCSLVSDIYRVIAREYSPDVRGAEHE